MRFLLAMYALLSALALLILLPPRPANADDESMPQAAAQADGITDRVVDNIWTKTDHYWHQGDYNRIIGLLRVCVAADPSFTEAYSDGAWLIWSMGDLPAANAFLADGEARSPNRAEIDFEFGSHLYFHAKDYAQALPYLKRSVDEGATDRMNFTTLAHCYRQLGRYDDSISVWNRVIEKFPAFPAGPTNLARVQALKVDAQTKKSTP